jgi:hypothetical protein
MMRNIFSYIVIFSLINMSGCTDFRALQRAEGAANSYGLSIGDTVQLETTDDQHLEFEITDITSTSIVGKHVEIQFDKIRSAKKAEINKLKTTAGVGLGMLATAILVLLILVA